MKSTWAAHFPSTLLAPARRAPPFSVVSENGARAQAALW
jgi:hypothetical protein